MIGQGGMGVVFRASHMHLDRVVALKVLAPWLEGNRRAKERFLRELWLAAKLDHPNVATVYDAGESDGQLYIAMRFVQGGDLHQRIERDGPLDVDDAVVIFEQIASALDAAHALGLVHRDIKPGNIMLDGNQAYLTDFGLTRPVEQTEAQDLTHYGEFMGTAGWAAPEQIQHTEIGPETDVYALGCVLYASLTASAPFADGSPGETMVAHLQQAPPKLEAKRSGLPTGVQTVIETAMAKAASDRYPSAGGFAAALRAAAAGATGAEVGRGVAPAPSGPGTPAAGSSAGRISQVGAAAPTMGAAGTADANDGGHRKRLWFAFAGGAAALAAVVVAIALIAGGGNDDGGAADRPTTTAVDSVDKRALSEYAAATDASVETLQSEAEQLKKRGGPNGKPDAVIERSFSLRDAVRRNARRLAALHPPQVVARDHALLVDGFELLADEADDAIVAAQNGDIDALRRFDRRVQAAKSASSRQIERAAAAIQKTVSENDLKNADLAAAAHRCRTVLDGVAQSVSRGRPCRVRAPARSSSSVVEPPRPCRRGRPCFSSAIRMAAISRAR